MAPLETYIAGDVWIAGITFDLTSNGSPVDPSTVVFSYSIAGADPVRYTYGTGGTPQIIRVGTGSYQISIDTSTFATAGTGTVSVQYTWTAQGAVGQGVTEGVVQVQAPIIPLDFSDETTIYLEAANNLADVANVDTALENLGIGTAALHPADYFDLAGDADAAQTAAEEFATAAVATEHEERITAEEQLAPLESPALTELPTAPTQPANTNNETISTTEYVDRAIAALIAALPTSDPHLAHVIWNNDGVLTESSG